MYIILALYDVKKILFIEMKLKNYLTKLSLILD